MTGAIFQAQASELIETLTRSVVLVQGYDGHGAGVIWERQGRNECPNEWLIVTNHHVAPGERAVVEMGGGQRLQAQVTARDRENDLALLRVSLHSLPAAPIGDSRALRVGDLIVAVGHPWGVRETATLGIVSASEMGIGRARREMLQVDIALAPGNSGGPLANAQGQVVGIASMVMRPGIALAVPSHVVQRFVAAAQSRAYRRAA